MVATSGRRNSQATAKTSDPKSKTLPSKRLTPSPTRNAETPTLPNLSGIVRKPIDSNENVSLRKIIKLLRKNSKSSRIK